MKLSSSGFGFFVVLFGVGRLLSVIVFFGVVSVGVVGLGGGNVWCIVGCMNMKYSVVVVVVMLSYFVVFFVIVIMLGWCYYGRLVYGLFMVENVLFMMFIELLCFLL